MFANLFWAYNINKNDKILGIKDYFTCNYPSFNFVLTEYVIDSVKLCLILPHEAHCFFIFNSP